MATVIDALVMTLGLDVAEFDKNRKRSVEDTEKFKKQMDGMAKDVALGGKKMAQGFSLVKNELLGLLALFGASVGLKDFIASNVKGQAELGRLSQNLNISARDLESWGLIAKEMGGQASDAFDALQSVAGGLAEASIRGHSAFTDMARANGVALTDAQGNLLNYENTLVSISRRLHDLPRQQALYLANQLGVGSMFNQLMLGPDELRKRLDAARGLTRVTEASTASAARLQRKWADIQQRFKETSEIAFARLSPVLERLAERFANWLDSVDWDKVARQIEMLAGKVNEVVKAFGGWKTVALVLGGVLATKVLAPVLGLVTGLGRLIPLLATTTAGLWGLVAAGSAVVGWKIGSAINSQLEGTKAGDWLGRFTGHVMAGLGNNAAWSAMQLDEWSGLSPAQRQQMARMYSQMNAVEKADYDRRNPELARLIQMQTQEEARRRAKATSTANSQHSQVFATNAELFAALEKHGNLPEGLLQRMFMQESGGGKNLLSKAGAKGPFQFMDATAAEAGLQGDDVYDLDKSAAAAAGYLVRLHNQFGSWEKAVAAYNAGPGNVRKYGGTPPFAETQNYVRQVLGGSSPAQRLGGRTMASTTNTSTAETHISKIEVHTAATDANGIVRDMRRAIADNALIASADTGLN